MLNYTTQDDLFIYCELLVLWQCISHTQRHVTVTHSIYDKHVGFFHSTDAYPLC